MVYLTYLKINNAVNVHEGGDTNTHCTQWMYTLFEFSPHLHVIRYDMFESFLRGEKHDKLHVALQLNAQWRLTIWTIIKESEISKYKSVFHRVNFIFISLNTIAKWF